MAECIVYWLFDKNCVEPERHGYVGITNNVRKRMELHRRKQNREFEYKILFEGTRQECLALENKLRPDYLIGWNIAPGGSDSPSIALSQTPESRKKRGDAQRGKPKHTPASIEKLRKAHTGKRHSSQTIQLFKEQRKHISLETREKMRQAQLGTTDTEDTKKKKSESARLSWIERKKKAHGIVLR